MRSVVFFTPGAYFFVFHCKSGWRALSWCFTTFTPLIFIAGFLEIPLENFLFSLVIMLGLYDCGYIYNDVITYRNEAAANSTDRLGSKRHDWTEKVLIILSVRLGLVFTLMVSHFFLFNSFYSVMIFVMLLIVFYIYNIVRSRLGLFLYAPLNFLKFFSTLTLTSHFADAVWLLVVFFTIPTWLCWLGKKKYQRYHWQRFFNDFDLVRLIYFGIIFLGFHLTSFEIYKDISLYMVILRIIYYFTAKGSYARTILARIRVK